MPLPALLLAATSNDPVSLLLNYGVVGIFAVILIYVVKALDARNTRNYDERIADKDRQIATKDAMIQRLQDILASQVVPAMSRGADVIEASTHKDVALADRIDALVTQLQAAAEEGKK